ncbi:MAG: sodium:solute symporter family protein [Planctomycetes bacterium]|nr:sodium:solute symporter family protein [Planctomycetota bacterium]
MDISAEALSKTNFTTIDWVIVICYPLISVVLGIIASRFISNMKDFVTAGQSLGTALGVATLTGTELGLITVMYSAQKGFTGGFAAFHIALVAGIVTFFVGASGFIIYRLRAMEVLTIPEYYRRRFGRKTQILGGVMMAFGGILNMGLFLKVGSMFLVGITGLTDQNLPLPEAWGLPGIPALPAIMIFLLSLVLIYTCLGGMLSVVLADYVQFVVLSFGLLLTSVLAIYKLGWNEIFAGVKTFMGTEGFDPTVAEGGFGVEYIIWMGFVGLIGCAVWPTSVARALSAESPKTVKKQFMFASISYLIRFLIPYFWGICAFVFIMTMEPQLRALFFPAEGAEGVENLYALPIFLGRILPPVVIGIISAGMIAAFMSTHDSYLLCWSSVLTQDVIAPLFGDRLGSKARIWITRALIIVIGLYVLYWGLLYEGREDVWDYMAVTGAIYFTGAFALLVGGLYWKRASSTGAVLALVAGSAAVLGLSPVQDAIASLLGSVAGLVPSLANTIREIPGVSVDKLDPNLLHLEISSEWVGLPSIGITILAMVIGSLLFPDKKEPSNDLETA